MLDTEYTNGRSDKFRTSIVPLWILFSLLMVGCAQSILEPGDFLKPPSFIDPSEEFGHVRTGNVTVPANTNIFLADAPRDTVIEYAMGDQRDTALENSPIKVLEGVISGGETLDIYANGTARHIPVSTIRLNPDGGANIIKAGPLFEYKAIQGSIGALVGMFSNKRQPFLIGRHLRIQAPRGARFLYLAMLDYPGASSNNEGEYFVTIDVIRR